MKSPCNTSRILLVYRHVGEQGFFLSLVCIVQNVVLFVLRLIACVRVNVCKVFIDVNGTKGLLRECKYSPGPENIFGSCQGDRIIDRNKKLIAFKNHTILLNTNSLQEKNVVLVALP